MALFLGPSQKLTVQVSPVNFVKFGSYHAYYLTPTSAKHVLRRSKKWSSSGGHAWPNPSQRALTRRSRCNIGTKAAFTLPHLLPATTVQGVWTGLIIAAAAGLWSERTRYLYFDVTRHECHRLMPALSSAMCCPCRIGKELSGPLVSTLIGLLLSNLGLVGGSNAGTVYGTVNKFILPLAIPLLLFSADLRCATFPQHAGMWGASFQQVITQKIISTGNLAGECSRRPEDSCWHSSLEHLRRWWEPW